MDRKYWWAIGGVVVVVVLLAIALGTNAAGTVRQTGPGYGYGPGPAQAAGQGAGNGPGAGANVPALLPQADVTPLSDTEIAWILHMRGEEQLAHDLYTRWAGLYTVPVFSNIAGSENTHISEVQLLVERYGLADRPAGNASAGYANPAIQSLYTTLSAQGDASLTAALEAGLAIEERDIADLDMALANTTRADIVNVYSNLRQGSVNHKSAFLRQLGR